jgi:ribosomal protein S27E
MPKRSSDTIRMICPKTDCINKSIVFRKFNSVKSNTCKNCGSDLVYAGRHVPVMTQRANDKAKKQLREFGL